MAKIRYSVSLTNDAGTELVSTEKLTNVIPAGGLSIDGEKLVGVDNFTIDARRAKCRINLVRHNAELNGTIRSILQDKSRLIDDCLETEEHLGLVFSKSKVEEVFADNVLFWRAVNSPSTQTWETPNTKVLAIQSIDMLEIFYTALVAYDNSDSYLSFNPMYANDKITYKKDDSEFHIALKNIIPFLGRGLQIHNSLAKSDSTDLSELFVSYLNEIYSGLGDNIASYIINNDSQWSIAGLFKQVDISESGRLRYPLRYLELIAEYLVLNEYKCLFPDGNLVSLSGNKNVIAIFLSSIIQKDWYDAVKNEYFSAGNSVLYMDSFFQPFSFYNGSNRLVVAGWHYIPFYRSEDIVNRHVWNVSSFSATKINIFVDKVKESKLIKCIVPEQNGVIFGKLQTATILDSNGQNNYGVMGEQSWTEPLTSLLNPVYRYYTFGSDTTQYKLYMDNFSYGSLASGINDTFICLTNYTSTNWMYFNNIVCNEVLSPINFYDVIPVYDEQSGNETDNYGLYIYRDYFDKYYVRNKSSLMNIYLLVMLNNSEIYRGIIDFNSIEFSRDSVSFDAIDAIGVMIENIRKLESFIEFSQFDLSPGNITADLRAGTNLKTFIESLVRNPFPYNTSMKNINFDIGSADGLENKILQEISAEDAFVIAVQCSKKLLYVNSNGKIDISNIIESSPKTIDGQILSIVDSQAVSSETFSIDKLKNVAGYGQFSPQIVDEYMRIRNTYSLKRTVEIYGQQVQINILDRILMDGKLYIVMEKEIDTVRKTIKLNLIGSIS